ncbi:UDP-2,4-diacetamido-2,4,6-trideoxy-beta-L-altropyranose hydrolase [Sphaerotilaceae bacterium SBD11-9]
MKAFAGVSVVFRVDASVQIGTGHVMRCLTLAAALTQQGAHCYFICRDHEGNLISHIRAQGHEVSALPRPQMPSMDGDTAHASWLGVEWAVDARETQLALAGRRVDWLVVDHYALDVKWESALAGHARRLLVIDDLADRPHACDALLDQNLGRQEGDYREHVPAACRMMVGPGYALLRPEFAALREDSLARRRRAGLRHLLVAMGGIDSPNATGAALSALQGLPTGPLPEDSRITVVMGPAAPWLDAVQAQAGRMPWRTDIVIGVADMAQRMADSDLAIGAAGVTAWERCCLGLPAMIVVLADNQAPGARALAAAGAGIVLGATGDVMRNLPTALSSLVSANELSKMSKAASRVTDGRGVTRVMNAMAA